LLLFESGIKRNLEWVIVVWIGNKEKSGASRRDSIAKHV
jgi:hypothetical protein